MLWLICSVSMYWREIEWKSHKSIRALMHLKIIFLKFWSYFSSLFWKDKSTNANIFIHVDLWVYGFIKCPFIESLSYITVAVVIFISFVLLPLFLFNIVQCPRISFSFRGVFHAGSSNISEKLCVSNFTMAYSFTL